MDEGKLVEALATYEVVYRTFEAAGARQQMAATLGQISYHLCRLGRATTRPSRRRNAALTMSEIGDEEGQAISLHQLSMLYMFKEDYAAALARSQEAEALARKLGDEARLASSLHQQGIIYTDLARAAADDAEAATASVGPRSSASTRAWPSNGASGTRPAPPRRWGRWANWMDAGQMREAIAAFNEVTGDSPSNWVTRSRLVSVSNSWAVSTNARASSRPRWRSISRRWSCCASTDRRSSRPL